jgi:hypothetical protein
MLNMLKRIQRSLPAIAAVALAVAITSLLIVEVQLKKLKAESGETRPTVDAAVKQLQASRPRSLDEPGFREALDNFSRSRYVNAVWLIRLDGHIAFSTAGFATTGSVQDLALDETRRVLSEIPEGYLSAQQRIALLAASTIQREGEHNDIFRQMIRPIQDRNDVELGFIGVSYAAAAKAGAFPGMSYAMALFLIPIGLVVYWVALPWWVFLDATGRKDKAWAWTLFVLLGNLAALFAYLLTRHPSSATSEASSTLQ